MALTPSNMLPLGTKAPDFELYDTVSERSQSLRDLKSNVATVMICTTAFLVQDPPAQTTRGDETSRGSVMKLLKASAYRRAIPERRGHPQGQGTGPFHWDRGTIRTGKTQTPTPTITTSNMTTLPNSCNHAFLSQLLSKENDPYEEKFTGYPIP